jgi:hypothetical protein
MTKTEMVQQRIGEILAASGYPFSTEDDGRYRVSRGSSAVFIRAHEWQERFVIVELLCPVLDEVACSEGLLEKLNALNEKLYFGKAYWRAGEVWLAHNLLGDHLDSAEFVSCVGLMAVVADRIDDELQKRFGGKRFCDFTAKTV